MLDRLHSSDAVTLATKIDLVATTGTITFNGALTTADIDTDTADAYNIALNAGGTITNATTFANTGTLTIGNAADDSMTFTGGIIAIAPSSINLAGTVATTNTTMTLGDGNTGITLTAATILSAGSGAINVDGAVTGGNNALTINTTGTGTLAATISGLTTLETNSGGTTAISADISSSSTQTYNDAVTVDGTLDFTGSTVQFASTLQGDGTTDIITISGNLNLDGAASSLTTLFRNL
jgi:hypothetical protein